MQESLAYYGDQPAPLFDSLGEGATADESQFSASVADVEGSIAPSSGSKSNKKGLKVQTTTTHNPYLELSLSLSLSFSLSSQRHSNASKKFLDENQTEQNQLQMT